MDEALQRRIRGLSAEQLSELFDELQQESSLLGDPDSGAAGGGEHPPLSFAQQRLWFLHRLQPESSAYHALDAVCLRGPLQPEVLARSLDAIVARHAVLRTSFLERDDAPVQCIRAAGRWPLTRMDLRAVPRDLQPAEVRRLAQAEQQRPFDLARGPLVRATLLQLLDEEHILLLGLHHVVADGWSIGLLRQELAEHYRALSRDVPPQTPELKHQYADFAVWQRAWLSGTRLAEQLAYWRRCLQDLPVLHLPHDHPRPTVASDRGGAVAGELPRPLVEALARLGQREEATRFMTLLAAFQVLLARYSGQSDFAVGTPIANRGRREWEGLLGFFVNSLVLRADLRGDPPFRELLARVRDTALEAYAHQDLPFEVLVQDLAPARDLSRNPLFQVMFGVHNLPPADFTFGELTLGPVEIDVTTSRFDLEVDLWEHPLGLRVVVFYSADLFEKRTIERLLAHYERLLQGIVAHPDRRVSELPLITDAERRQVLRDWNRPSRGEPDQACLHELFEAQVERTPDAPALSFGDIVWTYRQLDSRAERWAEWLQGRGVGPEIPVALCLSRSPHQVAAILAVLKAGGVYVPLEPDLPDDRIAYVLKETVAAVMLTDARLRDRFSHMPAITIGCCDEDDELPAPDRASRRSSRVRPDNLAYLMYTSGSTGFPKAVGITHRNVVRLFQATQPWFGFDEQDVVTFFHSYAFDFSVWEIWIALLFGGRLVVVPWLTSRSPEKFARLLRAERVTVLSQTPTAFTQLLHSGGLWEVGQTPNDYPVRRARSAGALRDESSKKDEGLALRWVIFGGERLSPAALSNWFRAPPCPSSRLVNMYGITETTVHTTWHELIAADCADAARSPIGGGLPDLQVYVLDPAGNPVPVGVVGEIHVGGAGLARGYWHNPALSADKFRPDPFLEQPGARLYRTGDLARRRPDGSLVFVGRCDAQLKIRGVRIEPGEIEAALRSVPQVRDAAVAARDDEQGEPRLVAYVVAQNGAELTADVLRHELRRRLPPAVVPSAFVFLGTLPRTPQGKIDRAALPRPASTRPELAVAHVEPRTPIEQALAEIWQETLGWKRVGALDHFFDLGGHSLQAARVVSRLRETFQIDLPLQQLFAAPVLGALAEQIETALRNGRAPTIPSLCRYDRSASLPLSFAQQRLWFLCQLRPGSGAYHVPLVAELRGQLNTRALQQGLEALVDRHEALRTTFASLDGRPIQRIRESGFCPLEIIDLRGAGGPDQNEALRSRSVMEQTRPFDLENGPLLRAALLQLSDEFFVLFLTLHHLVADGWSVGVFRRELAECYRAFSSGEAPRLEDLPIQYADFAQWQREYLQGDVLQTHLDYWRRQLADLPQLRLPADRRPAEEPDDQGAVETWWLERPLLEQLHRLNRREGTTLFITLLAAFQALLTRYTAQQDIVVGSPIANRGHREVEGLIGFFVNTLVLRTSLAGNPTFRELLGRVRDTALAAYAHQDLPFERLVEDLQPDRQADQNPLFQVMFALQNAPADELALPGLTIRSLRYPVTTTRFDLQWDAIEQGEGLQIVAYYRTALFDAATVQRMLKHYGHLLEQAVADPDLPLTELTALPAGERRYLFEQGINGGRPIAPAETVHGVFENKAAELPEAIALVSAEHCWTYRELNARANRLARRLRESGVGPDVPVALCLQRGGLWVAAALGILKAGGAYVPLDLDLPAERLRLLLQQSGAQVLVTEHRCRDVCHETAGIRVLCADEDAAAEALAEDAPNLPAWAVAENVAYVMYTSGSTGEPKGVGIPHRGVLRLVRDNAAVPIHPTDVVAQAAHASFDAATFEIWGPLLNGGRLVVVARDSLLSPGRLKRCIAEQGITVLFLTTALFNELVRQDPCLFAELRCLLFGGEAVDPTPVRELLSRKPPASLLHVYGPTETTTFATSFPVTAVSAAAATVPIGQPIANTEIYVLDADLQPAPIGVPGEVYLGGAGLARGYWREPRLTAERFVPHPFATRPGARLYRTGDVARFLADGNVEYRQRTDDQVKLRGFRIELEEIRSAVKEYPGIQDGLVVLREDEPGDKRLIAYVTTDARSLERNEQASLLADWRTFYDDLYRAAQSGSDPTFNLAGWTSSYTGEPLSVAAMREQVDQTVARILLHRPQRVLEIGCGTGLLLFRIAPHCQRYVGTDISALVLRGLREQLAGMEQLRHVELWERDARDFSGLPPQSFDAVVLNSVVQYFPSLEYLQRVLEGAARLLVPGGVLFLGDVRNFALWEPFQTTVELLRAPASLSAAELQQRVMFELSQETELLVHPAFFHDFAQQAAFPCQVHVEPKRGRQRNELTQFRYDVTLRLASAATDLQAESIRRDWAEQPCTLEALWRELEVSGPDLLYLEHVPNARVLAAVEAVVELRNDSGSSGELRERLLRRAAEPEGLDPEDFWGLADQIPYRVHVDWSEGSPAGDFNVLFIRGHDGARAGQAPEGTSGRRGGDQLVPRGNQPLRDRARGQLLRGLREHLRRRLPQYMVPASLVPLDRFPLTPNGKVDRSRLPQPASTSVAKNVQPSRERTPTEERVARVWAEVLRVPDVGLQDNFFDLGGHSLMAMQVVTRLRQAFGIELPVRSLFEAPTVADLALLVTQRKAAEADPELVLRQLEELEQLSEEQVRLSLEPESDDAHE